MEVPRREDPQVKRQGYPSTMSPTAPLPSVSKAPAVPLTRGVGDAKQTWSHPVLSLWNLSDRRPQRNLSGMKKRMGDGCVEAAEKTGVSC